MCQADSKYIGKKMLAVIIVTSKVHAPASSILLDWEVLISMDPSRTPNIWKKKREENHGNSGYHNIYPGFQLLSKTGGLARPTFLLSFLCPPLKQFLKRKESVFIDRE